MDEEHADVCVLQLQELQGYCRVRVGLTSAGDASDVFHDQSHHTSSRYGGESHRPVVIEACNCSLFRYWYYCRCVSVYCIVDEFS